MSIHRWLPLVIVSIALMGLGLLANAQSASDACPALVSRALTEVGDNCTGLERNAACYGYQLIESTFRQPQPADYFAIPADTAPVAAFRRIETAPLRPSVNEWGIAVMNVQANVPAALPGQAVTFMLFGDVELEDAVDPAEAFIPADAIEVVVTTGANVRARPDAQAPLVASVSAGTVLLVDGVDASGGWLRTVIANAVAWVRRDLITAAAPALDTLPVIDSSNRTPMQAFFFRTGLRGLECDQAPDALLMVQGPDNVEVNITANGADIRIGSTIALQTSPDGFMHLMTLSGAAHVDGLSIPAGFSMRVPLTADGRAPAGPWTGFRAITIEELTMLQPLEQLQAGLLSYALELPKPEAISNTAAAISGNGITSSNGLTVTATPAPGSTLNGETQSIDSVTDDSGSDDDGGRDWVYRPGEIGLENACNARGGTWVAGECILPTRESRK